MSSASLHRISLTGELLKRGFWLYVWEVVPSAGDPVLYVGMTGDTSSPNAQSPFARLSQHLGTNKHANALRRHLTGKGIEPTSCKSFDLVAYGPILPEADTMDEHKLRWSKVASLEKALSEELDKAGYEVLNVIHCNQQLDDGLWHSVRDAFAGRFPLLPGGTTTEAVHDDLQHHVLRGQLK
jgi:hypothetical protein